MYDEKIEFMRKLSKMDNLDQLPGKVLQFIESIVTIEALAEERGLTVHSDLCPMRVGDRWTYLIRLEIEDEKEDEDKDG